MSRKIRLFSTLQSQVIEKTVAANTKAELIVALSNDGVMTTDMDMIVRETSSPLVSDTEILPTNLGKDLSGNVTYDFTLFLSARKTKSGQKS